MKSVKIVWVSDASFVTRNIFWSGSTAELGGGGVGGYSRNGGTGEFGLKFLVFFSLLGLCVSCSQVLKDYTGALDIASHGGLGQERLRDGLAELTAVGLRCALKDGVDKAKVAEAREKLADVVDLDSRARKANVSFGMALDNSVRKSLSLDLARFRTDHPCGGLKRGEKRHLLHEHCPLEGRARKRSCIEDSEGRTRWEVPRLTFEDGTRLCRVIHLCSDAGSIGRPFCKWYLQGFNARGTWFPDFLHRIVADKALAESDAVLSVLKLEFRIVINMRQGPYAVGGGHHGTLTDFAKELFRVHTQDTWFVVDLLFEAIVAESDLYAGDHGSDRHREAVWGFAKSTLTTCDKDDSSRDGRWWDFENRSRVSMKRCSLNIMLLTWIGHRRQWWSTFADCPLVAEGGVFSDLSLQQDPPAAGGGDAAADANPLEEGGDDDAPGGDDGPEGRVSLAAARKTVQAKRNQCPSTLNFNLQALANEWNVRLWKGMVDMSRPVQTFFSELMERFQTRRGMQVALWELTSGSLSSAAKGLVSQFGSLDIYKLTVCPAPIFAECRQLQARQLTLVRVLWRFALTFAGHLCLTRPSAVARR